MGDRKRTLTNVPFTTGLSQDLSLGDSEQGVCFRARRTWRTGETKRTHRYLRQLNPQRWRGTAAASML